jgi:hypothetical protein
LRAPGPVAWLLPNYDEYLIAYKDRELVVNAPGVRRLDPESRDAYAHLLVIDGRLAGIWRRTLTTTAAGVEVVPYRALTRAERGAIEDAAGRYSAFLQVPVTVTMSKAAARA